MGLRVGRKSAGSVAGAHGGEIRRLRKLLLQLSRDDRPAFDALGRLVMRAVPQRYKKVYRP